MNDFEKVPALRVLVSPLRVSMDVVTFSYTVKPCAKWLQ